MPLSNASERGLPVLVIAMLAIGFLYSGTATVRFYRELFARPASKGSNATIDGNLRPVDLANGTQLRDAADRAGWPSDADVVVLAPVSSVSVNDLTAVHYSASYLLYPRRVWSAAWCDHAASEDECARRHALSDPAAAVAVHHARRVMLMGSWNPFVRASSRPVSKRLSLVDLE